jgi:hypothetical protein
MSSFNTNAPQQSSFNGSPPQQNASSSSALQPSLFSNSLSQPSASSSSNVPYVPFVPQVRNCDMFMSFGLPRLNLQLLSQVPGLMNAGAPPSI